MSPSVTAPTAALMNAPQKMLRFLSSDPPRVDLAGFSVLELWAIVGLGALVRPAGPARPALEFGADGTSQFALAMGLRDIERGTRPAPPLQPRQTIHQRAEERRPRRDHHRWLQFAEPPPQAFRVLVREAHLEDALQAADHAARHLEHRLVNREPVTLDFSGVKMVTQSYVHALLYEAVRLAWARQAPLYVVNATPAVRSSLEFLQNYALGG